MCSVFTEHPVVLGLDLNCSSDLHTRKSVGNLFHKTGPDTAKDRSPKVVLFVFEITRLLALGLNERFLQSK